MKKQLIFLGLALLAMLSIIFVVPANETLDHKAKVALGVGVFAIIVWISQALDDAQSGFCIVAFLVLFKAAPLSTALSGYANGGVWIVVLGMIMAAAMGKSGLSRRMALHMVSFAGSSVSLLYWMFALITLVMTFFIPSLAAKTLLLVPILAQMSTALGSEKGQSNMAKGLLFIVTICGTVFCMASLTSHAANPITAGLLNSKTGYVVTWTEWFRLGAFPGIACGLLMVPVIKFLWPSEIKDITAAQSVIKGEISALGRISMVEVYTLIVFLLTLALWATDKLHGLNATLVAMLSVIAIIAPGPQQVMKWKEAESRVPWNILIVYGAGLSMGKVLVDTGAANWIAATFFSGFSGFDMKIQVVIFIWIMLCLQVLFTGAGPKSTALTPVVIAYAISNNLNVPVFTMLVGMNMLHQYLLPVSNLPNIIGLATEEITAKELIKTGFVSSLFIALFMTAMVFTYWTWIGCFNPV